MENKMPWRADRLVFAFFFCSNFLLKRSAGNAITKTFAIGFCGSSSLTVWRCNGGYKNSITYVPMRFIHTHVDDRNMYVKDTLCVKFDSVLAVNNSQKHLLFESIDDEIYFEIVSCAAIFFRYEVRKYA
jgi:hypothetical protein